MVILAVAMAPLLLAQEELAEGTRDLYRGDYAGATGLAEALIKARPQAAAPRILLARANIAQGKYPAAYQELLEVLRLDPQNPDALYYLGRVCVMLSQEQYQQLFQMAPNSFRVHQISAEAYASQQNKAQAEAEYAAAVKANPRSVEVLDALGDLKRSDYKFEEADGYYRRAAELAPRDYASLYGLGACAVYQNEPQRAVEYFRRAQEADPNSAAARLALGDALLRTGQARGAVSELKKAVGLQPTMRQAYTLLARAYQRLGQSEAAEQALKKEQELARQEMTAREKTLESKDRGLVAPSGQAPERAEPPTSLGPEPQ